MMLGELGLHADEARTGLEAVERAAARSYDVILMDLQLPGIDGLEATRRIRAAAQGKPPRIIATTAGVTPSDEQRSRDAGMDAFLTKPLRLQTLASALSGLLTRKS